MDSSGDEYCHIAMDAVMSYQQGELERLEETYHVNCMFWVYLFQEWYFRSGLDSDYEMLVHGIDKLCERWEEIQRLRREMVQ